MDRSARPWRRFVNVGGRAVHVRGMGAGPPVLLIHSSPANSSFLLPEMERLAARHACFAFDTPGFGLSDPLPGDPMTVADLADATAAAMAAIGLPRCAVFGTHTGAAVALELGARHPGRVSGLILDGVPIFTPEEAEWLLPGNRIDLSSDPLGGQFARLWTRLRDQSIWFPWFARAHDDLNEHDLAAPDVTHRWMLMMIQALDHYRAPYSAAMAYGEGAGRAVASLRVPAIITASETDMLRPHIERLPSLPAGCEVRLFGSDPAAKHALIAQSVARLAAPGDAPVLSAMLDPSLGRQFVDAAHGPVFLCHAGREGRPLLVLHAVPGAGRQHVDLLAGLGDTRRVILPDLPGSGESVALPEPTLDGYAAMLAALLDTLDIAACDILSFGFSSALALRFAISYPDRVAGLALAGIPLFDAGERDRLAGRITPPITIERDGSHWFRLWQQLRDSLIWCPWFDTRRAALRRDPADFGARRLHDWTFDVMQQHAHYGDLVRVALAADVAGDLARLVLPPLILSGPADPLSRVCDDSVLALRPDAVRVAWDGTATGLIAAIGDWPTRMAGDRSP